MKEVFVIIMFVLAGLGMAFCVFMMWRNHQVYKYRGVLLEKISDAADDDIHNSESPSRFLDRYKVFNSVDYNDMVNKFWKPLDEFYPDKRFIEKGDSLWREQ